MIVLDGIIFSLQRRGGISSYFRALAARVLEQEPDARLWTYVGADVVQADGGVLRKPSRVLERYRSPSAVPRNAILHTSYYRTSRRARANVVTVYDCIYERFADPVRRTVHVAQKRAALNRADAIICISAATKADVLRFYPRVPESKMHVVHLAAGPEFIPSAARPDEAGPYALYVGTRSAYKNFPAAVYGVAAVPGMRLMCVGGGDFTKAERSLLEEELPGRYSHAGYVDDARLNVLYDGAHALLYTSLYEGFGIPILEAMATGCPVITTRAPAMVEVAGDGAMLVEADDDEAIGKALRRLREPGPRAELIARGHRRADMFSWDATAEKTLAIYAALA